MYRQLSVLFRSLRVQLTGPEKSNVKAGNEIRECGDRTLSESEQTRSTTGVSWKLDHRGLEHSNQRIIHQWSIVATRGRANEFVPHPLT